jgi:hypothetical protein
MEIQAALCAILPRDSAVEDADGRDKPGHDS